jgi:mannose-6-phosphate isomerase
MSDLYPLKFEPILKDKIWGGNILMARYGKKADPSRLVGESWELSAMQGDLSVVSNGFLAGNNIEELVEVYMGDLTGDSVFEKYGNEFPLLIKFIESRMDLSIQVHPDDEMARERHNANGKTEMWYILENEEYSKIYTGFSKPVTKEEFIKALKHRKITGLMNVEKAVTGDTFFTPPGRLHSIGKGTVLVEIQRTSDITYRIYDWDRTDETGKKRELHTGLALEAIDFTAAGKNKIIKTPVLNRTENLAECEFFVTNIIHFNKSIEKDYFPVDSFVIYICTEGAFRIHWENRSDTVTKGETVLLPAMISDVILEPVPEAKVLEVYISPDNKFVNQEP